MQQFFRKVIKITASMSPNVKAGREVLPGVLTKDECLHRRATWDKIRQTVGLDAEFYEGAEVLLFPPDWLDAAHAVARMLKASGVKRKVKGIGIDPAEGGDRTAMAAVDEMGLVELVSKQTPDTAVITGEALNFMRVHECPPENVCIDAGGGGKEHADRLRAQGFNVRTVRFGESLSLDPRRVTHQVPVRMDIKEEKYACKNRRAQLYGDLHLLLDASMNPKGFGIPEECTRLREELAPIPKEYDMERLSLRPKSRRPGEDEDGKKLKTLTELIGHSPDEADALVLAVHAMLHKPPIVRAGVA